MLQRRRVQLHIRDDQKIKKGELGLTGNDGAEEKERGRLLVVAHGANGEGVAKPVAERSALGVVRREALHDWSGEMGGNGEVGADRAHAVRADIVAERRAPPRRLRVAVEALRREAARERGALRVRCRGTARGLAWTRC